MTRQHHLKRAARDLAARRGLSYTAARRELLAGPDDDSAAGLRLTLGHRVGPDGLRERGDAVTVDLDLPIRANLPPTVVIAAETGAGRGAALLALTSGFLAGTGPDTPVLIVDDIDWADGPILDDPRVRHIRVSPTTHQVETGPGSPDPQPGLTGREVTAGPAGGDQARLVVVHLIDRPDPDGTTVTALISRLAREGRSTRTTLVLATSSVTAALDYLPAHQWSTLLLLRQSNDTEAARAAELLDGQVTAPALGRAATGHGWVRLAGSADIVPVALLLPRTR